jgi:hypothetical protein
MKLTRRGKVVLTSLFTSPVLAIALGVGIAEPAIAPEKANALVLQKFEGAKSLTDKDLVVLLKAIGFKGKALPEAWAIAKKESQGRPLDFNGNQRTGDKSYGLFQINMIGQLGTTRRALYHLTSNKQLLNPVVNATVAYKMSSYGKNWEPWKGTHTAVVQQWLKKYPYKSKQYKKEKKIVGAHKNQMKIKAALEARIAGMPKGSGFKKPGSMNRKKTGFVKIAPLNK